MTEEPTPNPAPGTPGAPGSTPEAPGSTPASDRSAPGSDAENTSGQNALVQAKPSINIDNVGHVGSGDTDDTASQSLADALKTSFFVLKLAMTGLVIAYLLSGFVRIEQGTVGVKVRMGTASGETLSPGVAMILPRPFEYVLRVPTRPQEATVGDAFFYANENNATLQDLKFRIADLDPLKDASLISADGGIVHARARVMYTVQDPKTFIEEVGLATQDQILDDALVSDPMRHATALVRSTLQQTLVELAAEVNSDGFTSGANLVDRGRRIAERLSADLQQLGLRLDLNTFNIDDAMVSPSVVDSYSAKTNAEQERDQALSRATEQRTKLLTEAAGRMAAQGLSQMIDDYEAANAAPDQQDQAQALYTSIMDAFKQRRLPEAYGGHRITGEASRLISEAEAQNSAYLSAILQETRRFTAYLESDGYQENPGLVKARLAASLIAKIFSDEFSELYLLPAGSSMEMWLNRDPELVKQIDQARLEEAAQKAREAEQAQ